MRVLISFLLFCLVVYCSAQNDKTFYVKKQSLNKKEYQKIFDLKLFPALDTLDVNTVYLGDITPAKGLYDSVAGFNMQVKIEGNIIKLVTSKYEGIGMLKLFKKDDKGDYTLLYVRNFTIAGKKKYPYTKEVKMPAQ